MRAAHFCHFILLTDEVFPVLIKDFSYFYSSAHYAAAEGHLPCLKFLVSMGISHTHILGARNDQGETPKDLANQFYKDGIIEYINGIEWERDHPEEAESKYMCT